MKNSPLDLAIELEKKGHEYYQKHAATAENPLAKKVLSSLASQELDHIDDIKEIAEGKKLFDPDSDQAIDDLEAEVKEVFNNFSKQERQGWKAENKKVYEHAMKLEKDIYETYQQLAEEAEDEDQKKFFQSLMKEESKHLEAIENVYFYLTKPKEWLAQEESKVWNWMNL
ncbi:ferritin family protein [Natroniella sulfidigena]|uniref:ferritin-like domain-containing protein n=1 Tax=Natroniella sulfidigena TaxID=723921 RepID=UPI00200B34A1|nr:ferritin family protein [Natroniella sulfidigena]MCK8816837.1 ferritin family protein [Natroniella sulfidigena]